VAEASLTCGQAVQAKFYARPTESVACGYWQISSAMSVAAPRDRGRIVEVEAYVARTTRRVTPMPSAYARTSALRPPGRPTCISPTHALVSEWVTEPQSICGRPHPGSSHCGRRHDAEAARQRAAVLGPPALRGARVTRLNGVSLRGIVRIVEGRHRNAVRCHRSRIGISRRDWPLRFTSRTPWVSR